MYAINSDNDNSSAPLSQTQYIFFFRGAPLPTELKTFAKNNNINISISPAVVNQLKRKKIIGKVTARDLNAFLSLLGRQYGFKWFIYADTLYITSSAVSSINLNIPNDSFSDVRSYLTNVGLMVPEFGYTELANQNKIIISGPREYLDLVRANVDSLHINNAKQQFAIYRLKYANAVDTSLSFNNQTINIPGVASLLSGLINRSSHRDDFSSNVNEMIKNRIESAGSMSDATVKNYNGHPQIEADPRLNTIIIRDNAENLKIYKNIIKTLDVQAPLIQIDVLIVRLDQDKLAQSGINWWASAKGGSVGFGAANLTNGPSNSLSASYNQVNPGQLIVTNIASFSSSLAFLEGNQYAKTQAKPSLATIDNLPAVTTTTENIFSANTNAQVMNNSPQNNSNSGFAYTGIQLIQGLQITPHVIVDDHGNKKIRLAIVLQDGSIDDFSNPLMPNYSQGYLSSQTIIDEGQSVVLAGYTKSANVITQSQVPFFGDIPGLGWLFKTKSSVVHRITTLYVVTPKVVLDNFYTGTPMGTNTDINKLNANLDENAPVATKIEDKATAISKLPPQPTPSSVPEPSPRPTPTSSQSAGAQQTYSKGSPTALSTPTNSPNINTMPAISSSADHSLPTQPSANNSAPQTKSSSSAPVITPPTQAHSNNNSGNFSSLLDDID